MMATSAAYDLLASEPVPRLFPALQLWAAEVASGLDGQDTQRPETWIRDDLFRAAMWELTAWEWLVIERDPETAAACAAWADYILQGHVEEVCDGV